MILSVTEYTCTMEEEEQQYRQHPQPIYLRASLRSAFCFGLFCQGSPLAFFKFRIGLLSYLPHPLYPPLLQRRGGGDGRGASPLLNSPLLLIPLYLKSIKLYRLIGGYACLLAADINLIVHSIHPLKVRQEQTPPEPCLHDNPILPGV